MNMNVANRDVVEQAAHTLIGSELLSKWPGQNDLPT